MATNEPRLRTNSTPWRRLALWRVAGLILPLVCLGSAVPGAQEDTRRLWDSEFLSKRAPAKSKSRPKAPPVYRVATPPPSAADTAAPGELVGVTVWRLRRPKESDSGDSRLLLLETDNQRTERVEWTPERVEADTAFSAGDRVRLSIESSAPIPRRS